jgi:hypothetical protein
MHTPGRPAQGGSLRACVSVHIPVGQASDEHSLYACCVCCNEMLQPVVLLAQGCDVTHGMVLSVWLAVNGGFNHARMLRICSPEIFRLQVV